MNCAIIIANLVVNIIVADCLKDKINGAIILNAPNHIGIGSTYDGVKLIPYKPQPSWILVNEKWKPPFDEPKDGKRYSWNEKNKEWLLVEENINGEER